MAIPTINGSGAVEVIISSTSIDIPYPSTVTAGDLLAIYVWEAGSLDQTNTPSGWTRKGHRQGTGSHIYVFQKDTVTGSESGTQTVTGFQSNPIKMGRMFRSSDADTIEAMAGSGTDSRDIDHPDIVTTDIDRLAIAVTGINDDETPLSFTGETGGDLTLLFNDTTDTGTDGGLSLQTAGMASSGTLSGGTWSYGGAVEDWVTLGFAIFAAGETTQKSINVTFTTTMVATPDLTHVQVINVAFITSMAVARFVQKTITVAFDTAFGLVKKVIPVAKAVDFVTSMVTSAVQVATQAIAVTFTTTMSNTHFALFGRLINVTFDYATVLSMAVKTAISFALGTTFTLVKKISMLKTVSFVTSMSLVSFFQAFRTFTVSFVTTMALTTAKMFTKAISVAFVTAMGLVTSFIPSSGAVVGGVWKVLRSRRGKRRR